MTQNNSPESSTLITLRDERILKELMAGACPFQHLSEKLWIYFTSEHAMRQRLAQLASSDHIESRLYPDSKTGAKFALYVLGSAGIEYLTELGYTADEIRTLLPSPHTVPHELVVTDVVRRLRHESLQMSYGLKYYDDPACRAHKKLLGLRAPIPDLLVEIKLRDVPKSHRILIVIHMGTQPVLEVVDKVLKQEHVTLFLCSTRESLTALRAAMQEHSKLQGMVYFSLIYDFFENQGGIFGNNYTTVDGKSVSLYQ